MVGSVAGASQTYVQQMMESNSSPLYKHRQDVATVAKAGSQSAKRGQAASGAEKHVGTGAVKARELEGSTGM